MRQRLRIASISLDHIDLHEFRAEAAERGFRFVERLHAEWMDGTNRFAQAGELLVGAFTTGRLAAIAGLNHDPYETDRKVGRLRHLYVLERYRRQGIGAALVRHILANAGVFREIRLRTDNPHAASFYESLGFEPVDGASATHAIAARPEI